MSADGDAQLLCELAKLLARQIELVRRGGFAGVERLAGRCGQLAAKISGAGLLEKPEHRHQREKLARLYDDLRLAISTQKDATAEQLKAIYKHRKTLAAYRNNI